MRHVEAAVLGALLESPATELDVSLDLRLDERNRIVLAAIERVRRRGFVPNAVTVLDELENTHGQIPGWGEYLVDLLDSSPGMGLLPELVETLRAGPLEASEGHEWPDPIPLGPPSPESLPTDMLPDWLRRHVGSVTETTQTPADMALLMGLSTLATALAGKASIRISASYSEPLNIWTCTVLPPANRKSSVVKLMAGPVWDYEAELVERTRPGRQAAFDERETLDTALKNARTKAAKDATNDNYGDASAAVRNLRERLDAVRVPPMPRLTADDVTSEALAALMHENHGRISILSGEGDIFRIMDGRYRKGVNFDHYKRAWTGKEPIRVDRKMREGENVRSPALTMGVTLQPSVLETLVNSQSFRGEGVFGRFLFSVPPSPIGYRKTGADVPELDQAARDRYDQMLRHLLESEPRTDDSGTWLPSTLRLSPDAARLRNAFEGEVEGLLRAGETLSAMPDWGGKLVGNITRVAGLLHVADQVGQGLPLWDAPISGEAMTNAVVIGRRLISHALVVFDALDVSKEVQLARYVLERALKAPNSEQLDRRSLHQRCRGRSRIQSVGDIDAPIRMLVDHHYFRLEDKQPTGGAPGTPWVRINPKARESILKTLKSPPEGRESDPSESFEHVSRRVEPENGDIPAEEQYRLWELAYAANAAGHEDLMAAWVEAVRREEVTPANAPIWAGRFQEAIGGAGRLV